MDRILELLNTCQGEGAVMPPTTLYNEEWMLRLALSWFAGQLPGDHPLAFLPGSRWYSEALMASQFGPGPEGRRLSESRTHADGVIGHFHVGVNHRGDFRLDADARQLVVAEAKMFSGLSTGTTNAPSFNQASRNVACIAEALREAGRRPEKMERLGFAVLAPAQQIEAGVFSTFVDQDVIRENVSDRVKKYGDAPPHSKRTWFEEWFAPTLDALTLSVLSWESVVEHIAAADPIAGADVAQFLDICLEHNRPSRPEPLLAV